jgi:hypothetical protein
MSICLRRRELIAGLGGAWTSPLVIPNAACSFSYRQRLLRGAPAQGRHRVQAAMRRNHDVPASGADGAD